MSLRYGVLAVFVGTNDCIDGNPKKYHDDMAFFDGWYTYRRDADGVKELFKARYKGAQITVVEAGQ